MIHMCKEPICIHAEWDRDGIGTIDGCRLVDRGDRCIREFSQELLYLVGPYRKNRSGGVKQHITAAVEAGIKLMEAGYRVIVPHTLSGSIDPLNRKGDSWWLAHTLDIMERCDGIVLMPGWEDSEGCRVEHGVARDLGLSIRRLEELV